MNNNTDLHDIDPKDFEFINMAGKQASVTQCKQGFEWNGRAVKELAGAGAVYVRLTKCPYITSSGNNSDNDDDNDDDLVSYLTSSSTAIPYEHTSTSDEQSGAVCFRDPATSAVVPPRIPATFAVVPTRTPVTSAVVPPRTPVTPAVVPSPRCAITPAALSHEPIVIFDDDHSYNLSEDFNDSPTKAKI